ncbi:MAG: hypothetical protein VR64_14765 [Desulfatitalea sp. BRH_c12]|nr:MAG: hypothetical protein VR64_14765 [Desulfatitalea sp. BRH_c12]
MVHCTPLAVKPQKPDGAQSIHRAFAIIRIVAHYNTTGVKLSKVSRQVDLPSSTTHRILSVLVNEGMVSYNALSKCYHLGIALSLLGLEAHQYELRHVYHHILEKIARHTGDSAFLLIQSGCDVLCVDRVVESTPIQVLTFDIGGRRPLGVGPGSLAILASLPEADMRHIVQLNERRYTLFNGYAPEDLQRMIEAYRQQGYIVNSVTPYTMGVGVALVDKTGNLIGAVSVNGIISKMDKKRQREIARLIQSEIGCADI